jgi:hypothetical protein
MARIESTYTETAEGRDKGKKFLITEMSAVGGYKWASRLLFAMANTGIDVGDEVLASGMAGLAMMGFKDVGKMPHHVAEPLMDDLLACVQVVAENGTVRAIFPGDIEEVLTLFRLQKAAWDVHISPFMIGVRSISESAADQKSTA